MPTDKCGCIAYQPELGETESEEKMEEERVIRAQSFGREGERAVQRARLDSQMENRGRRLI